MSFRSGFIAIIGRPNAGKSTLINQIMHEKVAIVSNKPQTTRNSIRAIVTDENSQLIFIDTPGLHKPKHELGRQMNKLAYSAISGVDVIYYIFDGSEKIGRGDEFVMDYLKHHEIPIFCVVNKIDAMPRSVLLELLMTLSKTELFSEIIPISAKTGDNVARLFDLTRKYIPEGPKYYPDDMKVDYPEQFILAEIIREKLLAKTKEEIPHSIAVVFDQFAEKKESILIHATILVERDSQKGIVIGKGGNLLKEVGQEARIELEAILGKNVFLELFVRVEKDWRNRKARLNSLGYLDTELKDDE
jgi:GTP-binding protein Era